MTCNQLMTLLAIYRGSLDCEYLTATLSNDLARLAHLGLVVDTARAGWKTTMAGDRHARRVLALEPR